MHGCSPVIKEVRSFASENQYHAGFYLIDPVQNKVLADYQGDKYFTPASNTKILTLYASKLVLPDPLPAYYIIEDSTTTYLWPTGNPTFLNPVLADSSNYLRLAQADSLILSYVGFTAERFGSGWAWDDYNTSYSPELSPFPIYSNFATFNLDSITKEITVTPSFLQDSLIVEEGEKFTVEREEGNNRFLVTTGQCSDCQRQRPFRLTREMVAKLFSDTLHIPVTTSPKAPLYINGFSVDLTYVFISRKSTV